MLYYFKKNIAISILLLFHGYANATPETIEVNTAHDLQVLIKENRIDAAFDAIKKELKPHQGSFWCGDLYQVTEAVLFSFETLPLTLSHLAFDKISANLAHRNSPCEKLKLDKALPFKVWSVSEVHCTTRCDRTLRHTARKNKTFFFELIDGALIDEGGVRCELEESSINIKTTRKFTTELSEIGWLTEQTTWPSDMVPPRGIKGTLPCKRVGDLWVFLHVGVDKIIVARDPNTLLIYSPVKERIKH